MHSEHLKVFSRELLVHASPQLGILKVAATISLIVQGLYFYSYGWDFLNLDVTGKDVPTTYAIYGFQLWAYSLVGNMVYNILIDLYDESSTHQGEASLLDTLLVFGNPIVNILSILAGLYLVGTSSATSSILALFMVPAVAQLIASVGMAYYLIQINQPVALIIPAPILILTP